MNSLVVIGEDELCCALGERLAARYLPGWQSPFSSINTRGVTKLQASLPRYLPLVHTHAVLCIADTDHGCQVEILLKFLPTGRHAKFLMRLAVSEADAWVLADRAGFAKAFGISPAALPRDPENLPDVKRAVLTHAARSTKRFIREEVPSAYDSSKPGSGYNTHLCSFVRESWNPEAAAQHSPSLARAVRALERLRVEHRVLP